MKNITKAQLAKCSNARLTTTSNAPSQQAVNSLFSQLFALHSKYVGTSAETCGAATVKAS